MDDIFIFVYDDPSDAFDIFSAPYCDDVVGVCHVEICDPVAAKPVPVIFFS